MGAIFDIIGSMMVKGMILFLVFRLTMQFQDVHTVRLDHATLLGKLNTAASVVGWDMKQAGYNYSGNAFSKMDEQQMTFFADVNNTGTAVTVDYKLLETAGGVLNLQRTIAGGVPLTVAQHITEFKAEYYDSVGNSTSDPSRLYSVRVTLVIESDQTIDGKKSSATWRKQLFPTNL
ncbi:MAG: hypothetical protein HY966_02760 [Ignavibacteriales bacterium]|nr:hypothetical protein [Ignavibacteriales bacterium]